MKQENQIFKKSYKLNIHSFKTYIILFKILKSLNNIDFKRKEKLIEKLNLTLFKPFIDILKNKVFKYYYTPATILEILPDINNQDIYVPEVNDTFNITINSSLFYNVNQVRVKTINRTNKNLNTVLNEIFKDEKSTLKILAKTIRTIAEELFFVESIPWTKEYFLKPENKKHLEKIAIPFKIRNIANGIIDRNIDFSIYASSLDIFYITELLYLDKEEFIKTYSKELYYYYAGEKKDPITKEIIKSINDELNNHIIKLHKEVNNLTRELILTDEKLEKETLLINSFIYDVINKNKTAWIKLYNISKESQLILKEIANLITVNKPIIQKYFYFITEGKEQKQQTNKEYYEYNEYINFPENLKKIKDYQLHTIVLNT